VRIIKEAWTVFFLMQLPAWLLVGLWLWRRQEKVKGRQDTRLCPRCGYDLRATPDRCPERGEAVAGRA
jgi:predicted amidophosphoribosyltransferase